MISRNRMRIDLIGQSVLLLSVVLLVFFASGMHWPKFMMIVLAVWQLLSAIHLFYAYRYVKKLNYLKTSLVIGISLPLWILLIGIWAYLPVVGLISWYFFQTVRDTIIVFRRPKSFWDLT